jgi:hypothetical protein
MRCGTLYFDLSCPYRIARLGYSLHVVELAWLGWIEPSSPSAQRSLLVFTRISTRRIRPHGDGKEVTQAGTSTAAELHICRCHRTARNAVDSPAGIYTTAVGGRLQEPTRWMGSPRAVPCLRSRCWWRRWTCGDPDRRTVDRETARAHGGRLARRTCGRVRNCPPARTIDAPRGDRKLLLGLLDHVICRTDHRHEPVAVFGASFR